MSYLTQLQTNNTNLQACIDKANALPEAGGGAGSSKVQIATGSFSIASNITTTNTVIVQITGLDFKPDEIYIYPYYVGGIVIQKGKTYFIGCYTSDATKWTNTNTLYAYRENFSSSLGIISTDTSGAYSRILSTDDGFSLSTSSNSINVMNYLDWNYIALKREV